MQGPPRAGMGRPRQQHHVEEFDELLELEFDDEFELEFEEEFEELLLLELFEEFDEEFEFELLDELDELFELELDDEFELELLLELLLELEELFEFELEFEFERPLQRSARTHLPSTLNQSLPSRRRKPPKSDWATRISSCT